MARKYAAEAPRIICNIEGAVAWNNLVYSL